MTPLNTNDPANTLGPVNIERAKKICACVPFIDNGSGVMETQDCIRHLIAEVEFLRNICIEVDALSDSVKELETMVYHTPPGQYATEGWTWRQQCRSERDRNVELEAECEAQSNRYAKLLDACRKLQTAWTPQHVVNTPLELAAVEVMLATSDINAKIVHGEHQQ